MAQKLRPPVRFKISVRKTVSFEKKCDYSDEEFCTIINFLKNTVMQCRKIRGGSLVQYLLPEKVISSANFGTCYFRRFSFMLLQKKIVNLFDRPTSTRKINKNKAIFIKLSFSRIMATIHHFPVQKSPVFKLSYAFRNRTEIAASGGGQSAAHHPATPGV